MRTHHPGRPAANDTPRAVARVAAGGFGALSRLRGTRVFHPDGVELGGTLRVEARPAERTGARLLDEPGEHPALLRFSRAVGLPEPLPDALGLSFRLLDVHGPGRHQDFLLVTSGAGPLGHHLLLPGRRGFLGHSFSSLLPYRIGAGALRVVGARAAVPRPAHDPGGALAALLAAAGTGELRFDLTLAALAGRPRTVGRLHVGERLPAREAERLAFNPWNTGGGIRPAGPLMGVRKAAYRGSQRGRGLPPDAIP